MNHQSIFEQILLDDSFVKCFAPIHIVQAFLGSSRTTIKNKLVTPIGAAQKLYTFIWIICFSFSLIYFVLYSIKKFDHKNTIIYVSSLMGISVQSISYLSNIIQVRFFNSTSSAELYVMIQKIDNILLLKEYKRLNHIQYCWNTLFVILIVLPFECGYLYYIMITFEYPFFAIFWAAGMLITALDLLLNGSLIYYMTIRLKYLNKIIKYNIRVKFSGFSEQVSPNVYNHDLIISPNATNADSGNLNLEKFLLSLRLILRSYSKVTEVFSFTVFNIATTSFFWTLVRIELMFEGLRTELISQTSMVTAGLWIAYYFVLLITLAFVSDIFIQEVRRTKLHCIHVLSDHFEGPIHQGATNILRAIEFMQPVFSVYGIFVLDKSFLFKLIGIITTNVVVVIQFTM